MCGPPRTLCRRVTLLNLFNKDVVSDDYRCGFCDVCVPDLDFKQELATDPGGNVDLDELVGRLNDLLRAAEPENQLRCTTSFARFWIAMLRRGC